jgi:alpha-D-ribose 1-methylphosphonate 5-triphosphate synthase subunit PhnH
MTAIDLAPLWRPENHQALFRLLLEATARPGHVANLSAHLGGATAALGVLATLCDNTQTLADAGGLLNASAWRFLDARPAPPEAAAFILAYGAAPPAFIPSLGTLEAPETGATVIVQLERLGEGQRLILAGPGISGTRALHVAGLAPEWLALRAVWCAHFPLGCDIALADASRVAILPRTTTITEG